MNHLKLFLSEMLDDEESQDESSDSSSNSDDDENEADLEELRENVRNALGDAAYPDPVCLL